MENSLVQAPSDINTPILFWRRYVDDIFVIWAGDDMNKINEFHSHINKIHENINFTMELENNNNIKFLDIDITKNHNKLEFNIYRKPTQTDTIIPHDSYHHHTHKFAAIKTYLHRCNSTPMSDQNKRRELEIIKQIATNNNFSTTTIEKVIHKQQQLSNRYNFTTLTPIENENKKTSTYRSITYPGPLANSITNVFRKYQINISFKTNNTIKNQIFNAKDKPNILEQNGVYKISCNTCSATYIGETGRSLKERITEHTVTKKENSHFGHHLKFNNHHFDIEHNLELLHHQDKGYKLNLLEQFEIAKFITQNPEKLCLNAKILTPTPPLYTFLKNPFPPPKKPPI